MVAQGCKGHRKEEEVDDDDGVNGEVIMMVMLTMAVMEVVVMMRMCLSNLCSQLFNSKSVCFVDGKF